MNVNALAASYNEYTQAYESGQISKDEYANLLEGLEVEKAITLNAEELQFKEQLNVAINAAIAIVRAAA